MLCVSGVTLSVAARVWRQPENLWAEPNRYMSKYCNFSKHNIRGRTITTLLWYWFDLPLLTFQWYTNFWALANSFKFHFQALSEPELCSPSNCQLYAMCVWRNNTKVCVCPHTCPVIFGPVCGTNLRTYWNTCYLERESCLARSNVSVSWEGFCCKSSSVLRLLFLYNTAYKLFSGT